MPDISFNEFLIALSLILVFEGLALAAFPAAVRRALETLDTLPPEALRWSGLLLALFGVFLLYTIG